jgi:D-xylose reductase
MIVISNVAGGLLVDILSYARIEPQVLQVELHPYLTQEPLMRLTKTLGIAVTAYSSFGPQSYLELGFKGNVKPLFEQDVVAKAAQAHEKGVSLLLYRVTGTEDRNRTWPSSSALGDAKGHCRHSQDKHSK